MSTIRIKQFKRYYKNFEDFCQIPNILTKAIGYDFLEPHPTKLRKCLMRLYTLTMLLSHLYCFYYISKEVHAMLNLGITDLALFLRLLSGFNYAVFGTIKFIFCLLNLKNVKVIQNELRELYPKSSKDCRAYKVNEYFWPKWMQTILYFYYGSVSFLVVSPLFEGILIYVIDIIREGFEVANFGYIKLYDILYGFDHHNPMAYILTYGIELMHAVFVVVFNLSADIWLLCYALQVCMHFDQLARKLEEYEPDERNFIKDNCFLANIVQKHQILLNLSKMFHATFGSLLMLLLMSTAATLCCAGVYTLTQGVGREFLVYVSFLPTVIGQYFLICYYGQKIIESSENVGNAAYNHPWYNASQSYKKSILIIIIRCQRPVVLSAIGLKTICLEAFKMVMGESYRIFTLLKQTMLN